QLFGDQFYFIKRQGIYGLVGLVILGVFANIKYDIWQKISKFFNKKNCVKSIRFWILFSHAV
ncbi:MAG: hypothetical protein U9O98_03940, partial [Asgard group archaeon]|nr:hypothetical protein [Asgard group archaeon]